MEGSKILGTTVLALVLISEILPWYYYSKCSLSLPFNYYPLPIFFMPGVYAPPVVEGMKNKPALQTMHYGLPLQDLQIQMEKQMQE